MKAVIYEMTTLHWQTSIVIYVINPQSQGKMSEACSEKDESKYYAHASNVFD